MENAEAYQSAKKRVEAKMGFYTHLLVYVAVILFLAIINLLSSSVPKTGSVKFRRCRPQFAMSACSSVLRAT